MKPESRSNQHRFDFTTVSAQGFLDGRRLTRDEEHELAGFIANGDRDARNQLVQTNLRLVAHIARGFLGRGIDPEDLIGEGTLGLIRAAKDFDSSFGHRFSTYAAYWIKARIRFALNNTTSTIRVPSHMCRLLVRWHRAQSMLCHQRGRMPTFTEVTSALDLTPRQKALLAHAHAALQGKFMDNDRAQSTCPSVDEVWDRDVPCEDVVEVNEQWAIAISSWQGTVRSPAPTVANAPFRLCAFSKTWTPSPARMAASSRPSRTGSPFSINSTTLRISLESFPHETRSPSPNGEGTTGSWRGTSSIGAGSTRPPQARKA
jgi:RNA polymerase sigma factor (sigma-70 family)